jgi:ATP-binding cassette subfamily G (WHITE) protein 2
MYYVFLDAISYVKYTYVGISLNELSGLQLTCTATQLNADGNCPITSGSQTIATLGLDRFTIGACIGALILYIFVCRIGAYVAVRFIKN